MIAHGSRASQRVVSGKKHMIYICIFSFGKSQNCIYMT